LKQIDSHKDQGYLSSGQGVLTQQEIAGFFYALI